MLIVMNISNIDYLHAQRRCSCCYDSLKIHRQDIVGERLKQIPYTGVTNVYVNSEKFKGTGFFISSNSILTAKHVLFEEKKPKKIFLHINSSLGKQLVILNKRDYTIFYKKSTEQIDDIAIVKIQNSKKMKDINVFHFNVEDFEKLIPLINDTINISGYSCDKTRFLLNPNLMEDTLTNKYITPVDSVIFNENRTIMGFFSCACFGDSGAPLWVLIGDRVYAIGALRGISNSIDSKKITLVAVMFNQQKVDWINSVLKE